ncbi:putative SprT family Zn-dependent metalloprotease [Motilibacter peucedani]|uniref:Putative SprT family Zn-dependent metalloprotease n=1 Tax=Motilibacter peucedani TaxID=598650 RepID=A0A420XRT6_9ACTN|nr:SprT-like domain-containing protein [Motilibacter peucedani]RKS77529.1 putative SprT family Zn-dependent metalloprotease [Motilibacter peucedani]
MELEEAEALARALMRQHGLRGWSLVFDGAKTRAGVCRASTREIGLSRVLTELHSPAEVRDTVLHEIAHALVGPHHGHDAVWRARAVAIGCSGNRCVSSESAAVPADWVGVCPAGHRTTRHRRPTRVQSCRRCSSRFDPRAVFTWTHQGRTVPMHPRYLDELRRLSGELPTGASRPAARGADGRAAAHGGAGDGLEELALELHLADPPPAARPLPPGAPVRLLGSGKYAGMVGVVEKRGRTRYHVRTRTGLVTAPFVLVRAL